MLSSSPPISLQDSTQPPLAWQLYFPNQVFSTSSEARLLCIRLKTYFHEHSLASFVDRRQWAATIPESAISGAFSSGELRQLMESCPDLLLACIGVAVCEVHLANELIDRPLAIRIIQLSCAPLPFRDLKAHLIGRLVSVQGTVVRASAVKPLPRVMVFQCTRCLQSLAVYFDCGVYKTPNKCPVCPVSKSTFVPLLDHPSTKCVNWQRIKIQEISTVDGDDVEATETARIPRIMEGELSADLIDAVVPGETVVLVGVLRTLPTSGDGGVACTMRANAQSADSIFMTVNSVQKLRSSDVFASNWVVDAQNQLAMLAAEKNIFQILVASFCPRIFGNEMVKLGMLLALFAGSVRQGECRLSANSKSEHVRCNPHVLVVGDPGLGKSQLLNFAACIAPRAVSVCANTSSAVGLTATVQDGGLEAGALVLADRGVCCIDEFDKIGTDGWKSLLAVMEQQRVSVAKAGVVCSLPARTGILAAANPINGHYNRTKSVMDNLNMDPALLSRFDLVFLLLDRPNTHLDQVLSSHVLSSVSTHGNRAVQPLLHTDSTQSTASDMSRNDAPARSSLADRLSRAQLNPTRKIDVIAMKRYIAHARHCIRPKLTEEAALALQSFYLDLRKSSKSMCHSNLDSALPVTTRHLESLIRLSEARAKMEMSPLVLLDHAQDVIELFEYCLSGLNTTHQHGDGAATADFNSALGRPMGSGSLSRGGKRTSGTRGGPKKFINELVTISANIQQTVFTVDELQSLYNVLQISNPPFPFLLDQLNEQGCLIRRDKSSYVLRVT